MLVVEPHLKNNTDFLMICYTRHARFVRAYAATLIPSHAMMFCMACCIVLLGTGDEETLYTARRPGISLPVCLWWDDIKDVWDLALGKIIAREIVMFK